MRWHWVRIIRKLWEEARLTYYTMVNVFME